MHLSMTSDGIRCDGLCAEEDAPFFVANIFPVSKPAPSVSTSLAATFARHALKAL